MPSTCSTNRIDVTTQGVRWRALKQLTYFIRRFLYLIVAIPLVVFVGLAIVLMIAVIATLGLAGTAGDAIGWLEMANAYMSVMPVLAAIAAVIYFYWSRKILSGKRGAIAVALGVWSLLMLAVLSMLYVMLDGRWLEPGEWHYGVPFLLLMFFSYLNPVPVLAYLGQRSTADVFPRHSWSGDINPVAQLTRHIRAVGFHRLTLGMLFQALAYLLAFVATACLIWLILVVVEFDTKSIGKLWEKMGYGLIIVGLASPLGGIQWLLRVGRSLRTPRQHKAVLENDPRPPVLYLRAFKDDERNIESRFSRIFRLSPYVGPSGIDEMTAMQFQSVGPVVAIGRPGEKLVSPGAAKEYVDDSVWLARVKELIGKASVVVVAVGDTDGLQMEYEALTVAGSRPIVIVFPPFLTEDEMQVRWEKFVSGLGRHYDLPRFDPRIRAMLLRNGFPPLCICADLPDVVAFMEVVLAKATSAILASPSLIGAPQQS